MNNLDVLNTSEFDESIENAIGSVTFEDSSNCCGVDGGYSNLTNISLVHGLSNQQMLEAEGYSNGDAGAGGIGGVSQDSINSGVDLTKSLVGLIGNKNKTPDAQDIKNHCGKRPLLKKKRIGVFQNLPPLRRDQGSLNCGQLSSLFNCFFDCTNHVESLFRHTVMFTGNDFLETFDGIFQFNVLTR